MAHDNPKSQNQIKSKQEASKSKSNLSIISSTSSILLPKSQAPKNSIRRNTQIPPQSVFERNLTYAMDKHSPKTAINNNNTTTKITTPIESKNIINNKNDVPSVNRPTNFETVIPTNSKDSIQSNMNTEYKEENEVPTFNFLKAKSSFTKQTSQNIINKTVQPISTIPLALSVHPPNPRLPDDTTNVQSVLTNKDSEPLSITPNKNQSNDIDVTHNIDNTISNATDVTTPSSINSTSIPHSDITFAPSIPNVPSLNDTNIKSPPSVDNIPDINIQTQSPSNDNNIQLDDLKEISKNNDIIPNEINTLHSIIINASDKRNNSMNADDIKQPLLSSNNVLDNLKNTIPDISIDKTMNIHQSDQVISQGAPDISHDKDMIPAQSDNAKDIPPLDINETKLTNDEVSIILPMFDSEIKLSDNHDTLIDENSQSKKIEIISSNLINNDIIFHKTNSNEQINDIAIEKIDLLPSNTENLLLDKTDVSISSSSYDEVKDKIIKTKPLAIQLRKKTFHFTPGNNNKLSLTNPSTVLPKERRHARNRGTSRKAKNATKSKSPEMPTDGQTKTNATGEENRIPNKTIVEQYDHSNLKSPIAQGKSRNSRKEQIAEKKRKKKKLSLKRHLLRESKRNQSKRRSVKPPIKYIVKKQRTGKSNADDMRKNNINKSRRQSRKESIKKSKKDEKRKSKMKSSKETKQIFKLKDTSQISEYLESMMSINSESILSYCASSASRMSSYSPSSGTSSYETRSGNNEDKKQRHRNHKQRHHRNHQRNHYRNRKSKHKKQYSLPTCDEVLNGRAGYLYTLLFINKYLGPQQIPENVIIKVTITFSIIKSILKITCIYNDIYFYAQI